MLLIEYDGHFALTDPWFGMTMRGLPVFRKPGIPLAEIPQLSAIAKEGESGRARINQITHWLAVPIAFFSGYGQLLLFSRSGVFTHNITFFGDGALETLTIVVSFVGGTMLLIWIG